MANKSTRREALLTDYRLRTTAKQNRAVDRRQKIADSKKGFTLIEILVAVAIIAILATIGFTIYATAEKNARDSKRKEDLRELASGIEVYHQTNNNYPPHSGTLSSTDTSNWPTFLGASYINKMPLDPINNATYFYRYISNVSGSQYDLCGKLENSTQQPSPNIINGGGGGPCGGTAADLYYHVSGP
jgi:prepilin-type N-terminal cleavage/methylation domain-containing protein